MRTYQALILSATLCLGCRSAAQTPAAEAPAPSGMHAPAAPLEAHAWLGQLVGEWDVVAVAEMDPEIEPMRMESVESVSWLGELWVIGASKGESFGEPFGSILTLGYDPRRGAYVGTWIDTMMPVLWNYSGRLEENGTALVLEAEGPNMEDPDSTMLYRDTIRIVSPDHKQLTSAMRLEDGTWKDFMKADYRRRP